MADPKLEEFTRAFEIQTPFLRQLQRYVRDVVQPQLEEYQTMVADIEVLKAQNRALREENELLKAMPVKRGPGRPRKHPRPEESIQPPESYTPGRATIQLAAATPRKGVA